MNTFLQDLRFFSHHGCHEEEKILGAWFRVSVRLESNVADFFIDYSEVYAYVQEQMRQPCNYLESLVQRIGKGLRARYDALHSIWVRVEKEAPPLIAMQGRVYVEAVF